MRTIKRIIKIHQVDGYLVYCLFNNGQSRVIDFAQVFRQWGVQAGNREYPLATDLLAFQHIELLDGTFVWRNIAVNSTDESGNAVVYPYDVDPIVMYEMSQPDPTRQLQLGLLIKQVRKDLGLTQEQLAQKSGTTKHYISKIENDKSGIELSTLARIIEGGLGKRLQIEII